MDSVTSKGNFGPIIFNFFAPVLKNKNRANVTDHTFLLKVATDTVRSRKELEMSAEEELRLRSQERRDGTGNVTVTELGLSSSNTAPAGH